MSVVLIRYPGSKAKLAKQILGLLPDEIHDAIQANETLWADRVCFEYREPFFGAGAIGFAVLRGLPSHCQVWLNDKDVSITSLWQAVAHAPSELIEMIRDFVPTPSAYEQFKEEDGNVSIDVLRLGFQKLALHQMSFSGLGVMSGGPLGGKQQGNAKYPINCRWNGEGLAKEVLELHAVFARFARRLRITQRDFGHLFDNSGRNVFIYCDPPYYEKGPVLYKHSMSEADHRRLAHCIRATRHNWAISYDDHEAIRELYRGYPIMELSHTYTTAIANGQRPKNHEILICKTMGFSRDSRSELEAIGLVSEPSNADGIL